MEHQQYYSHVIYYLKMPFIAQAFLGWRLGFNFRNFRIRNLLLEKNVKY